MKNNKQTWSLKRLSIVIGLMGLVILAFGLGLRSNTAFAEVADILNVAGWILLPIAAVSFAIGIRQELYGFAQSRQAKYGANSILLSLSFIGILLLINYVVYRHDIRWDLTKNKSFSISEQSLKVVKNLKKELKIFAFYSHENGNRQPALDTLEIYRQANQDKLKIQVIDPVRQPVLTQQYQVTSDGTLIFQSGNSKKSVLSSQEQDITNAILTVTQEKKLKVYFLQGHDELDPDNYDPRIGLSNYKKALENENYEVLKLSLFENKGKVPQDASVVVIAGPQKPLTKDERQSIKEYIDRQGRLLIMFQPQTQTGLEGLVSQYGVTVGNNIIIDPTRHIGNDPSAPAINNYKYHPITQNMRAVSVFPGVRSVQFKDPPQDILGADIALTSPQSWGETDLKNIQGVERNASDLPGPLSVASALSIAQTKAGQKPNKESKADPQARMVIVGNAVFAANGFANMLGNLDFFMNSIAWLSEQDNLISIRAKAPGQNKITLTKQQESWIFYTSVLIFPALFLILGGFIWWRRR